MTEQTLGRPTRQDRASLIPRLADRAKFIRTETVRLAQIAGAGHYSGTFSAAELLACLYYAQLQIDPTRPDHPDRDRFILSKGHAAIGLYPVLADLGYFPTGDLDTYTRLGSNFGDHPDMRKVRGIDFSSGSLGHGLSIALGIALTGRIDGRSYRTYCMVGDGELAEGQIWEAAMAASHFKVGSLVCIVDRNQLCIDGLTEDVMAVEPIQDKFSSFGWHAVRIDGHDIAEVLDAFDALPDPFSDLPTVLIADTVKGRGVVRMELNVDWHVGILGDSDRAEVLAELARPYLDGATT
jgi:transketolase